MAKAMPLKDVKLYPPLSDARTAGPITCLICGRVLAGRNGLVTHHKRCHPDNRPKWQYADTPPTNPRNLPYAERITSKGTKVCKLCAHMVVSIDGMYKHFKTNHPGISPDGNYKVIAIVHLDAGKIKICQIH